MLAVICSDGALSVEDMGGTCIKEKWIPILKSKDFVPCFTDPASAKLFCNRYLPKNWSKGFVELSQDEIEYIQNKGLKIKNFEYHNKISEINYEILEFKETPDFRTV